MRIQLIAKPQFLGLPPELGTPAEGQLQGPDAAKLIETAGRTCYDSFGKGRDSKQYAQHILEVNHGSVLEHAQYSFFITGVSRGLTHELVRHRVGVAISQRSTRYVDEDESPWILHPLTLKHGSEWLKKRWAAARALCQDVYRETIEELQPKLVEAGADKLNARKQARGAARGVLGNALETELVWSSNVRTLLHVTNLRASAAADAEIRAMAVELYRIMREELPAYFSHFRIDSSPDGIGECVFCTLGEEVCK